MSMRSHECVSAPGQARDMPKTRQVLEGDHSPAKSRGKRGKEAAAVLSLGHFYGESGPQILMERSQCCRRNQSIPYRSPMPAATHSDCSLRKEPLGPGYLPHQTARSRNNGNFTNNTNLAPRLSCAQRVWRRLVSREENKTGNCLLGLLQRGA